MSYDKELIAHKLQRWDQFITDYHLPEWESIPDFGLYMDQITNLLEQYLNFIPSDEKNRMVTASAINNYVRLKIMPAPVKRKYDRTHIAYLIFILTLKQCLSISDVQKIIPPDLSEKQLQAAYRDYCETFRHLALFFNRQVQSAANDILSCDPNSSGAVERLLIESTLIAGFSKILSEKLIYLQDADVDEVLSAEKGAKNNRKP
ncbi:MAG: DUF1836 domain-containing protein [Eubacteriales bacterium]|nr:DUF1836 domain-containing protein [Eubacteriales bacterium]